MRLMAALGVIIGEIGYATREIGVALYRAGMGGDLRAELRETAEVLRARAVKLREEAERLQAMEDARKDELRAWSEGPTESRN